ncbi:MAG: phosphoribosyltransferase [Rubritepida sp.]|nr:phosphoribosyltransferase [Rubritepida sp.]
MKRLGIGLLDALLPPACLTCDAAVGEQGGMCATCFARLSFVTAPMCHVCGVPFPHDGTGVRQPDGMWCEACVAARPVFSAARAALRYDDGAKALILPFKHRDRTELAAPLARHMARAGAELLRAADILVPVPLHRWRLFKRRHNQAALLGARLARLSGKPFMPMLLRRIRATQPLGDLGAREREAVLAGAFGLAPGAAARLQGRRVLLIDDVLTSGATADACARTLLAGGAASVAVLAAARVPDPRIERQP